jgi:thioredoxin-related protein
MEIRFGKIITNERIFMKKKIYAVCFVLFACFSMQAMGQEQTKGIAFEKDGTLFQQALQKCRSNGKQLFVDCYTSWCGPCKMMINTVFPQEIVGNFMNPKFVSLKINMEQGEGMELAKKWQISAYPTYIIFNANGQEVGRFLGGCKAEEFIDKVKKASTDNASAEMDKRYADGERSEAFLLSYLNTLGSTYKRTQCNEVAEILLKDKAETFADNKQLSDVFMKYISNPFCPAFIYTAKHPEKLIVAIGEMPVKMKLNSVWSYYVRDLLTTKNGTTTVDKDKLDAWIKLMEECNVSDKERLRLDAMITITEKEGDWNSYVKYMTEYFNNPNLDVTDLMLCRWCTPLAKNCKEEAPKKVAISLLNKRLDDLNSGKRAAQTQQGNMHLSGNLSKVMTMLIDNLNGKDVFQTSPNK